MDRAHTQTSIVVYTTHTEKYWIKMAAKEAGKSASRYLLDLHLKNSKCFYDEEKHEQRKQRRKVDKARKA